MRKIALYCCLLFLIPALGPKAPAQDAPKPPAAVLAHYYHVEFVVRDLAEDGKPINSRTYSTTISTEQGVRVSLRTGSRVPIATSSAGDQFQYHDLNVNIDVRDAHEVGRMLTLHLTADITSPGGAVSLGDHRDIQQPVFRQNRWDAPVLIPLGKPTVVFTGDDLDNKGSMQMVMTATLMQ
jgi:hypothetical protein